MKKAATAYVFFECYPRSCLTSDLNCPTGLSRNAPQLSIAPLPYEAVHLEQIRPASHGVENVYAKAKCGRMPGCRLAKSGPISKLLSPRLPFLHWFLNAIRAG